MINAYDEGSYSCKIRFSKILGISKVSFAIHMNDVARQQNSRYWKSTYIASCFTMIINGFNINICIHQLLRSSVMSEARFECSNAIHRLPGCTGSRLKSNIKFSNSILVWKWLKSKFFNRACILNDKQVERTILVTFYNKMTAYWIKVI